MPRLPKARLPLMQAALELFVEQGVAAASIRAIAAHARCSEAALYRHWRNKEDLVETLFIGHLDEVRERLEAAIATSSTMAEQVRSACQACYHLYDEQPLTFRFVLLVQHELARHLPETLRMPQDVVIDLIRRAVERGELPARAAPQIPLLAAMVIGMFLETAAFVLYGRLPGPLSRYVDPVSQATMQVLRSGNGTA
jgi:AcrR family transcriptional regulator